MFDVPDLRDRWTCQSQTNGGNRSRPRTGLLRRRVLMVYEGVHALASRPVFYRLRRWMLGSVSLDLG
jgi:hypothetical protein